MQTKIEEYLDFVKKTEDMKKSLSEQDAKDHVEHLLREYIATQDSEDLFLFLMHHVPVDDEDGYISEAMFVEMFIYKDSISVYDPKKKEKLAFAFKDIFKTPGQISSILTKKDHLVMTTYNCLSDTLRNSAAPNIPSDMLSAVTSTYENFLLDDNDAPGGEIYLDYWYIDLNDELQHGTLNFRKNY